MVGDSFCTHPRRRQNEILQNEKKKWLITNNTARRDTWPGELEKSICAKVNLSRCQVTMFHVSVSYSDTDMYWFNVENWKWSLLGLSSSELDRKTITRHRRSHVHHRVGQRSTNAKSWMRFLIKLFLQTLTWLLGPQGGGGIHALALSLVRSTVVSGCLSLRSLSSLQFSKSIPVFFYSPKHTVLGWFDTLYGL